MYAVGFGGWANITSELYELADYRITVHVLYLPVTVDFSRLRELTLGQLALNLTRKLRGTLILVHPYMATSEHRLIDDECGVLAWYEMSGPLQVLRSVSEVWPICLFPGSSAEW